VQLEGNSAIVTGGAGGLGEATTRRLAAAGAGVVIADLAEDKAKLLADELGERVRFVRTDVTDPDDIAAAIAAAQELGPLRVSVSAHGGPVAAGRVVNREGEPLTLDGFRGTLEAYLTDGRRGDDEERAGGRQRPRGDHQHREHRGVRGPDRPGRLRRGQGRGGRHDDRRRA
jgi:NAD(P)-dependent dehydrogenase (short-subunit alcohol dehydrogenase family)